MDIVIQGKGPVRLTDREYLTEGGEGKVYRKGNTIFKIFHDPSKMPNRAKITELQTLNHPAIINPDHLLIDKKGDAIGYTMRAAPPHTHMTRVFTTDFRNQVGITPASTVELIEYLRSVVQHVHSGKCLVVDLNENNFLVDEAKYTTGYLIDTCSYQTPSFPATALMDNIRDYQAAKFSELSDWFSFGILACQLIIGIHPYKGAHPSFKKTDFISRMKSNVSIWNPSVRLPAVVRDMALIPENYKDWMVRVFEKGERHAFPDKAGKIGVIKIPVVTITTTGSFNIDLLDTLPGVIAVYRESHGTRIIRLDDGSLMWGRSHLFADPKTEVVLSRKMLHPYFVSRTDTSVTITGVTNNHTNTLTIANDRVAVINDVLYAISQDRLTRLDIAELAQDTLVVNAGWALLPGRTEAYQGLLAVNALGEPFLIIPEGQNCHFAQFGELKGYRLVAAKYENRVAILVGKKGASFTRFVVRFSQDHTKYDVRIIPDVATADINFTVLPQGIAVHVPEDGEIEIFENRHDVPKLKVITDSKITTRMRLANNGSKIVFSEGNKLYTMSMK